MQQLRCMLHRSALLGKSSAIRTVAMLHKAPVTPVSRLTAISHPPFLLHNAFSSTRRTTGYHDVAPGGALGHFVPLRVRNTIVSSHPNCDNLCDIDGWDSGLAKNAQVQFADSAALRLRRRAMLKWQQGGPSTVLVVKKPGVPEATNYLRQICNWLADKGVKPIVERPVHSAECPQFDAFNPDVHDVDFCITLGGDGTVLHLASLFEEDEPLPPVISFAMGTLGFLTPFDVTDYSHCLTKVLNSTKTPLFCTLRTRKRVELRHEGYKMCVHNVLNEVVIDRGAFPGAVLLELFADGHFVTNIEADGLIIATPSGSTAYSMSAGGPMVAPSVPCTILTPIAPLSLSFRPLVIPESSDIVIHLPEYARSYARCSFDGKKPIRMRKDSTLTVTTSLCPLPMINLGTLDSDWYEGITHKLKWNQTIRQPPKLPSNGNGTGNGVYYGKATESAATSTDSGEYVQYP